MANTQSTKENERRTIRMRKQLVEKIEGMAEKDNRNFNNMVETLLIKATEQYAL